MPQLLRISTSLPSPVIDWDIIDRCGAGRFSTGEKDPFLVECTIHDYEYLKGGTVDDMVKADRKFYKGIWRKALKSPKNMPRALLYTAAVSFLARWWWRNEPRLNVVMKLVDVSGNEEIKLVPTSPFLQAINLQEKGDTLSPWVQFQSNKISPVFRV